MHPSERQELHGVLGAAARRARRRGMGDAASDLRSLPLPGSLERYVVTGAPMSSLKRDLGAISAQIPRWVYGGSAVLAILLAAKAYKSWRDEPARGRREEK